MTRLKIFSDSQLSENAARLLERGIAPHQLIVPQTRASSVLAVSLPDPEFSQADIAFGQPDLASIASSKRLKWLHLSSAGFTRYDTPEFRELVAERGLRVTNSSGVYAAACAEQVLTFMLAHARRLPQALRSHAANGDAEWFQLRGDCLSLRGQQVVILGFGGIATQLVKLLAPFEMQITAMRRHPRGDEGLTCITVKDLAAALATADHVINILPDNAASQNFIHSARLAQIKPGAVFYNIGRGNTVDQDALLAALRSGQLAAAWLDVTTPEPLPAAHPLRHELNCFITPHIAGGHADEAETLVRHFLANLQRFQAGSPLLDQIF